MERNEYVNNNYNAASGSWSDGPMFDLMMLPCYSGEVLGDDTDGAAAAAHLVSKNGNIYLPYKDHIKYVP